MLLAINKNNGTILSYDPDNLVVLSQCMFNSTDDFMDFLLDTDLHAEDYLLIEVENIYKPEVDFKKIGVDDDIYD
jgi:hypothetical protein